MLDRLKLFIDNDILKKFQNKKVLIIGIGGVGGFALECLVRTGFQNIVIIDKDIVDISNLNRQIISLNSNVGQKKIDVAIKRAKDINPNINIEGINEFLLEDNIEFYLNKEFDYVIDCCDTITTKINIMKYCTEHKIKYISCMGTGNRIDSSKLEITKLNKTYNDPLSKNIRRILKEKNIRINPYVVWSSELPFKTHNRIPGSMIVVPMQAGNLCASYIIKDILNTK